MADIAAEILTAPGEADLGSWQSRATVWPDLAGGSLFAAAGALLLTLPAEAGSATRIGLAAAFGVTGVALAATGIARQLRARRAGALLRRGAARRGVVTSVNPTGTAVAGQPVFELVLTIDEPDGATTQASLRQVVPLVLLAQVQPGMAVAIRVDPRKPRRVAIDWSARPAGLPGLPTLALTGTEPPNLIHDQVRAEGGTGRAVITSVAPGSRQDGKQLFLVGLSVQMDSGACVSVASQPTLVDPGDAEKVSVGRIVAIRAAHVGPATVTVLDWGAAT